MNKLKSLGLSLLSFSLIFFSQITISDAGFTVEAGDVSSITTPLYTWVGSLFNLLRDFAPVVIFVFIVGIFIRYFMRRN